VETLGRKTTGLRTLLKVYDRRAATFICYGEQPFVVAFCFVKGPPRALPDGHSAETEVRVGRMHRVSLV
jgi:hypothetical protein